MTTDDFSAFDIAMQMQVAYYGKKDFSDAVLGLYFGALANYDLAEVESAIHQHVRDPEKGKWFPKVADLVAIIDGNANGRGLVAWDEALRQVRRVGSHLSPDFDDPLIRAAIDRMSGWPAFCSMTEDWTDDQGQFHKGDKDFKRKQFLDLYASFCRRAPDRIPARLFGTCEILNAVSQYREDPRALASGRAIVAPEALDALPAGAPPERPSAPLPAIRNITDLKKRLGTGIKALGTGRDGGNGIIKDVEGKRAEAKARLAALIEREGRGSALLSVEGSAR